MSKNFLEFDTDDYDIALDRIIEKHCVDWPVEKKAAIRADLETFANDWAGVIALGVTDSFCD